MSSKRTRPNLTHSKHKHSHKTEPKETPLTVFYKMDENEIAYQKKLDEVFVQIEKYIPNFEKESQQNIKDMVREIYYAMKYEPTLRAEIKEYPYEEEVIKKVNEYLEQIIKMQENVMAQLSSLSTKGQESKKARPSIMSNPNNSNIDLSLMSEVDDGFTFSDLVDYIVQFMMTVNYTLELITNMNTIIENKVQSIKDTVNSDDNAKNFNFYETLLADSN